MKKQIAVSFFVLLPMLMLAPNCARAQETPESNRKILTRVIPQYPALARSLNIEGNVKADVLVAAVGTVQSIEVKGGHPVLAKAAQDALKRWKWEPASHETHEIIEIRFKP